MSNDSERDKKIQELTQEYFKDFDPDHSDSESSLTLDEFIKKNLKEPDPVKDPEKEHRKESATSKSAKFIGYDEDGFAIYEL